MCMGLDIQSGKVRFEETAWLYIPGNTGPSPALGPSFIQDPKCVVLPKQLQGIGVEKEKALVGAQVLLNPRQELLKFVFLGQVVDNIIEEEDQLKSSPGGHSRRRRNRQKASCVTKKKPNLRAEFTRGLGDHALGNITADNLPAVA